MLHMDRPVYGEIREVSAVQMVEEIDSADPRVFVVVHLYEMVCAVRYYCL